MKILIDEAKIDMTSTYNVVEIGCGNAYVINYLEDNTKWNIDGVDINIEALNQGKITRGNLLFYNINEKKEEYRERYDIIFLLDVIEHIKDDYSFIQDILFHLKPGGYIIINVPALQQFYSHYDLMVSHQRRYSKKELINLFKKSHLNVKDTRYWAVCLVPLLFLRKLILAKKPDAKGTVKIGFKPPSKVVNKLFIFLSAIERAIIKKPLFGASLMSIVQKIHD